MKVYRDISNKPINLIDSYPFDALTEYDIVIFREGAALGRHDGPTLESPIKMLRDNDVSVLLWCNFGGMPETSPSSDWRYQRRLAQHQDWIAITERGDRAVIWPGSNGLGYHLNPYAVKPEEYGPFLGKIAKDVGATGLLLDFIDPMSKPYTPPGYERPAFALTTKGLDKFNEYRDRTIHWLVEREKIKVLANGRGPQVETSWYVGDGGIHGCYWEQFGVMHDQGADACRTLEKMAGLEWGHNLLDPGWAPAWAQACEALLDGPVTVEDHTL